MDNLAYRDEPRYEVINGTIVMMSPRPAINHLRIIGNIYTLFKTYLRGKRCEAFTDGADVHLDEKNTVIPDVMIVCNKDSIKGDGIYGAPDLIVKVLSPSTASRDRKEKRALYETFGVKEYWIVSPGEKSIEVHLLQDGVLQLDNAYALYPDWQWAKMTDEEKSAAILAFRVSLYDDFTVDLRDIFENVD